MRLAQPDVIDSCAYWIAAHALALLLVIFLTALGVIAALWHLFETRRLELRVHPDGWSRRVLERPFAQRLRQRYPPVGRFFGARFASDRYLGLHLTIGLLVTLAAMLGFGALADAVADREELTEFDQQLAMSLHQNGTIDQVRIFEAITRFGDYRTLVCLGLAVSLTLFISCRRLLLVGWVVALTGSGFLNAMLKALFHRVRPVFANPWLTEPGWSFPSGHAMGSLVAYAGGPILRWGILAPGEIAAAFTHTLHTNTDQRVVAVASRSKDRAVAFGRDFGISNTYDSYDQLLGDDNVDIVYIAAPHSEQRKLALLAILVEKPFTVTADEARDIVHAARQARVFAMEAMWTRYLPQTDIIRQLLADGDLGDVSLVTADLGFACPYDADSRWWNPTVAVMETIDDARRQIAAQAGGCVARPSR